MMTERKAIKFRQEPQDPIVELRPREAREGGSQTEGITLSHHSTFNPQPSIEDTNVLTRSPRQIHRIARPGLDSPAYRHRASHLQTDVGGMEPCEARWRYAGES